MNTITFNKKVLITLFLLLWGSMGWMQNSPCIVYDDITLEERTALGISEQEFQANKSSSFQTNSIIPSNYTITPKQFRVNFWSVMNDEGTKGVKIPFEVAAKYLERVNRFYEPHQICFVLNGNGVLKSTSHMKGKLHWDLKDEGILKDAYADDAINVYIADSLYYGAHGVTNYFSNAVAVKESAIWSEEVLLAHEIGHALSLMHTHGDFNRPSIGVCYNYDFATNCEHVTRDPNDPNYNASTKGDLVHDTAADPGLFSNPDPNGNYANCYNFDTSTCSYIGSQVDCQGTPYVIDFSVANNIMSYGSDACKTLFTPGQGERIHYQIDNANPTYQHVKRALVTPSDINGFDLMVRNSEKDFGYEPDTLSQILWNSPDVWVRNVNDYEPEHQNPIHSIGTNYVKIRITNRGCSASDGNGKIKLYWAKAGTNLPDDVWEGNIYHNGVPLGGFLGEANLTVIESYESKIYTIPWSVPDPNLYSDLDQPWHFCLLAKIETPADVSALPDDNGYSNNMALSNVSVIYSENAHAYPNSGLIHIGNFDPIARNLRLELSRDTNYFPNTNIFDEAEVKFTFGTKLWDIWQESSFAGSGYTFFGDKTVIVNEHTKIIFNNFPANDFGVLNVKINFLIPDYTPNTDFGFNVEHWNNDTTELMGGELYLIHKNERELFDADGYLSGASLNAIPVNEPAEYNWYDSNGNLLHTGQTYNLTNSNGTYLLEVISDYDGFKDYKQINVTAVSFIRDMYPNPVSNNVTIEYEPLNCNTAYIMLININNNSTTNHIIDLNEDHITIDISQLPAGLYRVVLVCDNNVMESNNLIIQ